MSNIFPLQHLSSLVLNCITDFEEIISSGSKLQSSIMLMQEKFCLIDLLHLCINSFFESPRVVVSENLKNLSGDMSSTPFRIFKDLNKIVSFSSI